MTRCLKISCTVSQVMASAITYNFGKITNILKLRLLVMVILMEVNEHQISKTRLHSHDTISNENIPEFLFQLLYIVKLNTR